MSLTQLVNYLVVLPGRIFGGVLASAFLAAVRLWVGWDFFKSGLLKVTNWQSTLFLFREEYHVPLLSSNLAAVAGTAGELAFPLLIWAGLASRLSALGLSAVNIMAVIAYAHVLLAEGFEAALAQHYLWGFALLVIVIFGPGKLSADHWLTRTAPGSRAASMVGATQASRV